MDRDPLSPTPLAHLPLFLLLSSPAAVHLSRARLTRFNGTYAKTAPPGPALYVHALQQRVEAAGPGAIAAYCWCRLAYRLTLVPWRPDRRPSPLPWDEGIKGQAWCVGAFCSSSCPFYCLWPGPRIAVRSLRLPFEK